MSPRPARPRSMPLPVRVALVAAVGVAIVVSAILTVPAVGPWLADAGRDLVGPAAVAKAEDLLYGALDAWEAWRHGHDAPVALWDDAPPTGPSPLDRLLDGTVGDTGDTGAPEPDDSGFAPDSMPPFSPDDFAPPVPAVALRSDGHWSPFPEPLAPIGPGSGLARAMVHPDAARPYAAVAVVAMDLRRLALRIVPGTVHPRSDTWKKPRPGLVPIEDRIDLVAIFNGGWEAANGHLGLGIDGEALLPLNDWGCTLLVYEDDHVALVDAPTARREAGVRAFRQLPPCLVRGGVSNRVLADVKSRNWGTAVGGATIVPRSGVGISADGETLYYAKGNALSAETLAVALVAAGARTAALLDINGSYPRFYALAPDTPWDAPTLVPLTPTQPDPDGMYLDRGALKDFFYLIRR